MIQKLYYHIVKSARIDGENNLIREKSDDLYDMCRTGEWNKSYIWPGEKK